MQQEQRQLNFLLRSTLPPQLVSFRNNDLLEDQQSVFYVVHPRILQNPVCIIYDITLDVLGWPRCCNTFRVSAGWPNFSEFDLGLRVLVGWPL